MHRLLPVLLLLLLSAFAAGDLPTVGGIPIDFILFALTLPAWRSFTMPRSMSR